MTKTELLSTYTAEQLAEMVVELRNVSKLRIAKCEVFEDKELLKGKCDKCGEEFILSLDNKYILCAKAELYATQEANRQLNKDVSKLQSEVEKYRKAFEEAKKERDCQIAEYRKKIEELEHDLKTAGEKMQDLVGENMKLQCERNDYKSKSEFLEVDRMRVKQNEITDFLPTEPIKVADMLIHNYKQGLYPVYAKDNKGEIQKIEVDGKIYPLETGEHEEYSELRQIAEHLLVYCNHNGESEG